MLLSINVFKLILIVFLNFRIPDPKSEDPVLEHGICRTVDSHISIVEL